jgi:arsenate reductase
MARVTIYHNPNCGTSRNVLGMLQEGGHDPQVIEYLKTPPTREQIKELVRKMGVPWRQIRRVKGTPYAELNLGDPSRTDEQLLDAIEQHPILMNRPIVVTPLGAKLCRPSETVKEILPK